MRSRDDTIVYSIDFVCVYFLLTFLYQQLKYFPLKINFIEVIMCRIISPRLLMS